MDSSKSLEISVDLGNLPHLLNDLAQSVRSIQDQVDQINHAIRMSLKSRASLSNVQKLILISMKLWY